jgi:flavin-dependent dehydrogenase
MSQVAEQLPSAPVAITGGANGLPPKVIIIGAGIAGLTCGCYLQMNGIPTEILEAGELPGGLCTSWKRGHYMFDGCLRWLMGAQPIGGESSVFHRVWRSSVRFLDVKSS